MSQPFTFHSIPVIVNKYVDIIQFESVIDMDKLKTALTLQEMNKFERQNKINNLNDKLSGINRFLSATQKAIDLVIKYEAHEFGNMQWLYNGGKEIITIYKICGILEFNIADILRSLDTELYHDNELKEVLDTFNQLLEMNLQLKRNIHELQLKLEVANQYHEINECVLKSLKDELESLKEKFSIMKKHTADLNVAEQIKDFSFKELRSKIRESDLITNCHNEIKFIALTSTDQLMFNIFIELRERFKHLIAAMKYIPNSIEMFLNTAKNYYPNEILKFVEKYGSMIKDIASMKEKLNNFQSEIIISRLRLAFLSIMEMVNRCSVDKDITEMVNQLETIKDICELTFEERQTYGMLRSKYVDNSTLVGSMKLNMTRRRVFSNPISETLKLKPSLSADVEHFELFEKELKLIENVKSELNASISDLNNGQNNMLSEITNTISSLPMLTPKSNSNLSAASSPDNLKIKDIFDSPDPFVTPTSKRNRKSRIPVKTPNTTPNTSKYVALPTSTEPIQVNSTDSGNNMINTPQLLDFSSSKLISTSSSLSPPLKIYTPPPKIQHSSVYKSPRTGMRPSLIPLPVRPESRLEIIRATSRLDMRQDYEFNDSTVHELEERADNIQQKTEGPRSLGNGQVIIPKVRSTHARKGYFSSAQMKPRISTL